MPALAPHTPTATETLDTDDVLGTNASLPPDARELATIGGAAVLGLAAWSSALGTQVFARWLPTSIAEATSSSATLVVVARFLPWLITLAVLSLAYAVRWLPRAHQRLLEPSLVSAWAAVIVAGGIAYGLGTLEVWPWTWASTTPDVATVLTQFVVAEQYIALTAWLVAACLLVPIVLELVFRYALLEFLRDRGVRPWIAVTLSSLAFGATYLRDWSTAQDAAIRHALIASALGVLLALLVMRSRRGRGLGLAILAHASFAAVQLAVLLRALMPS